MSPGHPLSEALSLLKPLCLRVFVVKNRFYCRIKVQNSRKKDTRQEIPARVVYSSVLAELVLALPGQASRRALIVATTSAIGRRTCSVVSRSRRVTVLSVNVSPSTVMQ